MNVSVPKSVSEAFRDEQQELSTAALGMWIFLASEVLFFGSALLAFALMRIYYPVGFAEASTHLGVWWGTANTVILLVSSALVALSEHASEDGRGGLFGRSLLGALGLASVFLGIKGYEYWQKFQHHHVPGEGFAQGDFAEPAAAEMFFMIYFALTGLHAVHVIGGIGWMVALLFVARRDQVRHVSVQTFALYWHFVDIVWIFLFPLLYLIA